MSTKHRTGQQATSNYITPEGWKRLNDELTELWRVKRPGVTQAVADAAALGDRSENAEYIYGKKQLREIDRRIRFLAKRLDQLVVVERRPDDRARVYFGAWVELEDETGNAVTYRIVGPDEFDLQRGWISMNSPLARALMNRIEGDEISVSLPGGKALFVITKIRYEPTGGDRA
ncbi:MAG: transcription elongation factor GreB [Gammaproteobacteria bacterium]|nr:transcription elongation factor GreB [Gammaproteobacteria bacterium]